MIFNFQPSCSGKARPFTRLVLLALLLTWMAALAYLSLAASVSVSTPVFDWDKLNHFAAYAVLTTLSLLSALTSVKVGRRVLLLIGTGCFAYGFILESLQWFMQAGRMWELGDLLANALGVFTACVIFRLIASRSFRP